MRAGGLYACVTLAFILMLTPAPPAQDQVPITILYTNDLHAMLLPFEDEATGETVGGFSRISALVQQVRQEEENVLLADGGDALVQDQQLEGNYFKGEPVVKAMNQMGYDLAVPGNHDFEFGLDILAQRVRDADFPYLAANIVAADKADSRAQELLSEIKPYVVIPVGGVKIGFLGLTQPLHDFPGIQIEDTLRVAKAYVPKIRQEADIVVVIAHQELDSDYEIVDQVDGIDLLLAAHDHSALFNHGLMRNGVLIFKTSSWGREVGRIDLVAERDEGGFRLQEAQSRLMPVASGTPEDPAMAQVLEPYLRQAGRYRSHLIPILIGVGLVVGALLFLLMRRAMKEP
jgi:2',3'-cyclic-nucleotide 2'-phosphodiesterase (5'-nucleotidase family)